ncbi:FN3 associated domain-containing protein [Enterococcus quebecensis]|uniref:WxL domain-containing protein n=1 Tax=Enterococcus quebecensis TaxID=903983 RepID=A0A1E5GTL3_9ENTE|nr:FN3 associated domain-containing protein [Enterococcus quebecensis]OEG16015.1 hypothetical protein BCR23_07660 [Enterococcus quebecensis]OJG74991.1 hypothetical protein RV12_GL002036 [Enterococcus quebecensis]
MKKGNVLSIMVKFYLLVACLLMLPVYSFAEDQQDPSEEEIVSEQESDLNNFNAVQSSFSLENNLFTIKKEISIAIGKDDAKVSGSAVNSISTGLDLHGPSQYDTYLRFKDVSIPEDAVIKEAYLVFSARNASNKPTNLKIFGELGEGLEFGAQVSSFTNRTMSQQFIEMSTPANVVVNQNVTTASLLPVVNEMRASNSSLNNSVFKIVGDNQGSFIARSFESNAQLAPKLVIEYESAFGETVNVIDTPKNIAEEYGTRQYVTQSSNLEIGGYFANSLTPGNKQITGVRFNNVQLPKEAEIEEAYLEFVTASTTTNNAVSTMEIRTEMGETQEYQSTVKNISNRQYGQLAVRYEQKAFTNRKEVVRTANVSDLINEQRLNGWTSGNALAFKIDGNNFIGSVYSSGKETAPKLVIRYKYNTTPPTFNDVITDPKAIERVFINEVSSEGTKESKDTWIELYNDNEQAVLLDKDVYVTNKKKQAELTNIIIPAKEYRTLYLDGKSDRGTDHLAFELSSQGDVKLLEKSQGKDRIIDMLEFKKQKYNQTYGRKPDGSSNTTLLNTPTFNYSNNEAKANATLSFDHERGIYETGFNLSLTADAGLTIAYTLDGSDPTKTNGVTYTGPIDIKQTCVVKAVAFDNDRMTEISSHTFVLQDNYKNEKIEGIKWRHKQIVNEEEYASSLKQFPIVSVTSDLKNLDKNNDAIGTFEYIDAHIKSGNKNYVSTASSKKYGQFSANQENSGVTVKFNRNANTKKAKYSFFETYPNDAFPVVKKFARLKLKEGQDGPQNDIYGLGYNRYDEKVTNTLAKDMKKIALDSRYVHYYYNGKYMGLKTLKEDFGEKMFEEYFGGNDTDYTKIRFQDGSFPSGTIESDDAAIKSSVASIIKIKDFQEAKQYIDMDDFIKTQILFMFVDTEREIDAVIANATVQGDPNSVKMTFNVNDTDGAFHNNNLTGTRQAALAGGGGTYRYKWNSDVLSRRGAGGMFGAFSGDSTNPSLGNLEFKTFVKDQVLKQIGPAKGDFKGAKGAPLSVDNVQRVILDNTKELELPYKLDAAFMATRKTIYTDWLKQQEKVIPQVEDRVKFSLQMWQKYNMAHTLDPVEISNKNEQLVFTNPNVETEVYYTLDGTDPMGPNGSISESAVKFESNTALNSQSTVTVRAFQANNWGPISRSVK